MEKIKLCVGGTSFITTKQTLSRYPDTRLAKLDPSSGNYDQLNKEYYFDRDPAVFTCILNLYRTKELHVTQALCGNAVRNELEFWNISETLMSPCCWRTLHVVDQESEILESLNNTNSCKPVSWRCGESWRSRVWRIMEDPNSSLIAKIWNGLLSLMIVLSSITYCLDSLPDLRVTPQNGTEDYDTYMLIKDSIVSNRFRLLFMTEPNSVITYLDRACLVFFTIELLIHLIVCPHFKLFACSFLNWIDILTVLIGWTILIMDVGHEANLIDDSVLPVYLVLKSLYVTRLFRMFRLMLSHSNLRIIFLSVMACKKELLLMVSSVLIFTVIFGSFEYFCEDTNSKFHTIPASIWWAVVTMTTVGYGDMYPTTTCGYIVGAICAFLGTLALTLPIVVIANHFSDYYTLNQWRIKSKSRNVCASVKRNYEKREGLSLQCSST